MISRLHLKAGVPAQQALEILRTLISAAEAVTTAVGHDADSAVREAYVQWVENVESQLLYLTHDPRVIEMLHSARYWHIRSTRDPVLRPWPLVAAERDLQKAVLTRLADDLHKRVQQLSAAPGDIAVLDTNVLLHYQEPPKIRWGEVLGSGKWRLMIPLRVVEELDSKKYSGSVKLASRARALLPLLEQLVGDDGSPRQLNTDITIEVAVEPGQRSRPSDADEEILALCAELPQLTGASVNLVTGYTGMRLRARAQETAVATIPEKYLRIPPDAG